MVADALESQTKQLSQLVVSIVSNTLILGYKEKPQQR